MGKRQFAERFTQEEIAEMVLLASQGTPRSELCRRYRVKPKTLEEGLRPHGVVFGDGRVKFSLEQEREIARRYESRESPALIAADFSCSIATVRNVVHRQGGVSLSVGGRSRVVPEEQRAEILRLRQQENWSQERIAAHLAIHQTTVSRILREAGFAYDNRAPKKGGAYTTASGYRLVLLPPNSPFIGMAHKGSGYVMEHRLVMAQLLGRPLEPAETVHHVDGNRLNNDPSNLQLRAGRHGTGVSHRCRACGSYDIETVHI